MFKSEQQFRPSLGLSSPVSLVSSITDLAGRFGMTLTGIKKHVKVLENAGLVTTEKVGRVRNARLGPRRLEDEAEWITQYQRTLHERLNRLEDFLQRKRGET